MKSCKQTLEIQGPSTQNVLSGDTKLNQNSKFKIKIEAKIKNVFKDREHNRFLQFIL